MYYSNYYPYYAYPNMNLHNYSNNKAKNYTQNNNCQTQKETKKDIVNDTIPFENFHNTNITNNGSTKNNKLFSITSQEISICGVTLALDDLIIIAIMILLFIESDENMLLIFVLGLLLLNINLGDIMSIF